MTRYLAAASGAVLALAASIMLTLSAASAQNLEDIDTSGIPDMTLGAEDAPVTVYEYASFTCPHCAAFHRDSFDKIKSDYIDTGKVRFVYREIYFNQRPALWAAIVARCGENFEDRYFGIASMIYEKQRDWATLEQPADIVGALKTIGKTAGLTDAQLDQCFSDGDNAQKLYARYLKQSQADDVNSTPTFIINGEYVRGNNYEAVKAAIDEALGS